MQRRPVLAVTGVGISGAFTGCASDSTEEVGDNSTTTSESNADSSTEQTSGETVTETATATRPKRPLRLYIHSSGRTEINIESKVLVVNEGEYSSEIYVAADIANGGNGRSGSIKLTAEWYDSDGNYLDNDSAYLQTLGAGEAWAARAHALVSEDEIDDFELQDESSAEAPEFSVDGLELESSEMKVGEREAVITGKVKNDTGEDVSYIEAIGTVYNSVGRPLEIAEPT